MNFGDDEKQYQAVDFLMLMEKSLQFLRHNYTGAFHYEFHNKNNAIAEIWLVRRSLRVQDKFSVITFNRDALLNHETAYKLLARLQDGMEQQIRRKRI